MTYEVDLEKYVPQFIREMGDFEQIFKTQKTEIELEWTKAENTGKQIFPDDADWSITLWEKCYAAEPSATDTLEDRRQNVIMKLVPPKTVTLAYAQQMADRLAGEGIWIEEEPELSHVNLWVMDPEIYSAKWSDVAKFDWRTCTQWTWQEMQLNLSERGRQYLKFLEWWKEYKPAHLGYTTQYFKMRWKDCLPYTWRDLSKYTWLGLLLNLKQMVAKWKDVEEIAGTWKVLSDGYTWRTTKQIKENSTDENQ